MAFRFRAAAAPDVRRNEEADARVAAVKAEEALDLARARAQSARDAVAADGAQLLDVQQAGAEQWRVQWHRAWLDRERVEAQARARDEEERAAEALSATRSAQEAFKRRRVLERLRDRAFKKHQRLQHEQHVRDMNDLATLRFVAQIAEGGTHAD